VQLRAKSFRIEALRLQDSARNLKIKISESPGNLPFSTGPKSLGAHTDLRQQFCETFLVFENDQKYSKNAAALILFNNAKENQMSCEMLKLRFCPKGQPRRRSGGECFAPLCKTNSVVQLRAKSFGIEAPRLQDDTRNPKIKISWGPGNLQFATGPKSLGAHTELRQQFCAAFLTFEDDQKYCKDTSALTLKNNAKEN